MSPPPDGKETDSATTMMPAMRPEAGGTIGEFALLRLLGKGGMAEVWLAEQHSLKRNVALKLLKPELMSDPTYVKRFQSEAKAAGGLTHPNIVQVYSIGQADGRNFIAQEYVQGSTLKSFLQKKGALDAQTGLHIMRQVASALQAASERGIVHRDIKPENIMLTRKGEVKVADFGLAQLMGGERLNLTQEGTTMGTPLYMSPEQVNGQKLDQRSDLYSFGVTAYHMFAGETPFRGESAIAVAMQHLQNTPKDLAARRPDLPKGLCEIIHRMLAKKPDDRYPNAQKVLVDLKKLAKSLKDNGEADELELKLFDPADASPSLAVRRPWLVLTLLCLLTGVASAGVGWMNRARVPEKSVGLRVPKEATAEAQFHKALMVNEPEYYEAVDVYWPESDFSHYRQLAAEQLTLLYLQGVSSSERAELISNQIDKLAAFKDDDQSSVVKAAIARAYFQIFSHPKADNLAIAAAKKSLENARIFSQPQGEIRGTWAKHLEEVQSVIDPDFERRLGNDPQRNNSPGGGRLPGPGGQFGGFGGFGGGFGPGGPGPQNEGRPNPGDGPRGESGRSEQGRGGPFGRPPNGEVRSPGRVDGDGPPPPSGERPQPRKDPPPPRNGQLPQQPESPSPK